MLIVLLGLTVAVAAADTLPAPGAADVDGLVAYALANHPALAAADAGRQVAEADRERAGSLPDPTLMWSEMIEPVETRVGPQQRVLSLQQPLPWPGTLGARDAAAAARVEMAAAGTRAVAVQVAAEVRRSWARAAWLAESRALAARQLTLVRNLEAAVRSGYEAGTNAYGDLLQVQLEVARIGDRLRGLDDEIEAVRAALNAALGRDPGTPLELPDTLAVAGAWAPSDTTSLPSPSAGSLAGTPDEGVTHPRLRSLDHGADAARLEARAARRAGRPSFSLGVDWIQVGAARASGVPDSGQDALVAKLGVTLPLWRGKHDGAARAAEGRALSLTAQRRAAEQALAVRRTAAVVAARDADRRRRLYADDLLPRARQAYEAVMAGYRSGATAFADVLAAERTLLELEHGLLAAWRDQVVAAADLDEATGELPAAAAVANK